MKLINPRGKEVDFEEKKANKILSLPAKIKQGWKRKVKQKSLDNLKQNKPKKVVKKPTENKK